MSFWNDWRRLHWQIRFWSRVAHLRAVFSVGKRRLAATPRVLHVTPSWFADESCVGGGERFPTELARAMATITPTRLLSFGPHPFFHNEGALELEVLKASPLDGHPFNPLPLAGMVRAISASDVVHVHQWRTAATQLAVAIGAALGRPVFVSDHGGAVTDLDERYSLASLVTEFLADSKFSTKFLPCSPDTTVIGGGVPEVLLEYDPGAWPRNGKVVFLGRLMPHKGIDVLIRACAPELPLVLIGRPYDTEYYQYLQELAGTQSVEFLVDASDEEVSRQLREATVLVLPSVHRDYRGNEHSMPELLGLVMLEAMACGTPVVCTDAGGMPEFVDNGKTGFVVPWGQVEPLRAALHSLVGNPELAARMGTWAREEALARFSWRHVAERCLTQYRAGANER